MDPEPIGEETGLKILSNIKDVEIDPTELDQLFAHEHPMEMTEAQRALVAEGLRRGRKTYLVEKKEKAAKKRKPPVDIAGLDLNGLDLDLGVK